MVLFILKSGLRDVGERPISSALETSRRGRGIATVLQPGLEA